MKDNVLDMAKENEVYKGPEWRKNPVLLAQFLEKLAEHIKKKTKRHSCYIFNVLEFEEAMMKLLVDECSNSNNNYIGIHRPKLFKYFLNR